MKTNTTIKELKKGFTLIELLIVIVIIGILAVAVLSAINPVEQIRKATDTGKKSNAAELLSAIERYYTTFLDNPWGATTFPDPGGASGTQLNATASWLGTLVTTNEIKPEFTGRESLSSLYLWEDASTELVKICFAPQSQAFRSSAVYNGQASNVGAASGTWVCVPE